MSASSEAPARALAIGQTALREPVLAARRNKWIVWAAIAMHYVWGGLLVWSADPLATAPLSAFARLGRWGAVAAFVSASTCSCIGLASPRASATWRLAYMLPQQALMMMSALGAMRLIWAQHYADGVPRPWAFMAADQAWGIVAAVFHTIAILDGAGFAWTMPRSGSLLSRS